MNQVGPVAPNWGTMSDSEGNRKAGEKKSDNTVDPEVEGFQRNCEYLASFISSIKGK